MGKINYFLLYIFIELMIIDILIDFAVNLLISSQESR